MSNLATITNNILADSGIDDINVIVSTGSYANPAWITSLAWTKITGAPLGDYLPLTGGTLTGPLGGTSASFSADIQSSSFFRSNTPRTNSVTIGVSANANYAYIGNDNMWGIRTGTAADFNIDVNNSASPINALKITSAGYVWLRGGISGFTGSQVDLQVPNGARIANQLILHNGANTALSVALSCIGASSFQVDGSATFNSTVTAGSGVDGNGYLLKSTNGTPFRVIDPTSAGGASSVNIGSIGTAIGDARIHATNVLFLSNDGNNQRMTILANGNVGMGTPSPSVASGLGFVLNSGANQGRIAIKTSSTGDAAGDGLQIGMSGLDAFIEQRENADLTFATNATEKLRITSGGNVLIGNPPAADNGARLQVSGDIRTTGTLRVEGNTDPNSGAAAFFWNQPFLGPTISGYNFEVRTGNTGSQARRLFINESGAATFSSSVTAITNLRVNSIGASGSAYSAVLINSPVVTWNLVNDDNGGSGDLRFYNDSLASDAIRIKRSNNNVLINSSSDNGARLQVSGRAYINNVGGSVAGTTIYGNDQSNVRLRLENVNGRTWELTGGLTGANNSDFTIYDVTASATRMVINSSGNVGIGTTPATWSTGTSLEIGTAGNLALHNSNAVGNLIAFNTYYNGDWYRKTTSVSLGYIQDSEGHKFYFNSSGGANTTFSPTERMRITSDGNVRFTSINASSATYDLNYRFSTPDSARIRFSTTSSFNLNEPGELSFWTRANDAQGGGPITERMRIASNGIITMNSLAGSGNRIVVANSSGTLISAVIGSGLAFDGTTLTATGGGSGSISGSGTSGTVALFTGATSIGNSIITQSSSNVGVGTGNPNFKLNVFDAGVVIASGQANWSTNTRGIMVDNTNNGDESVGIWFRTGSNHLSGISGQRTNSATDWSTDLRFYTHPISTTNLTSAFERMRITSEGNVGIGTGTPSNFIDGESGMAILQSTNGRAVLSLVGTRTDANEALGRISFTNSNSTNAGSKRVSYISGVRGSTNNSAYLEFAVANDALGSPQMILSQLGNLLVGVGNPSSDNGAKLQVTGNASINGGSLTALRLDANSGVAALNIGGVGNLVVDAPGVGGGRFIINTAGNVGINQNTPTNLLHLSGSSATPSLRLGSISTGFHYDIGRENATTGDFLINCTVSGVFQGTYFKLAQSGGAATFSSNVIAASYNVTNESVFRGGLYPYKLISGGGTDFGITIFSEGGTGNGNIYFCPNGSATKVMTINTSSRVLIGTDSDNGNRLRVNGTIFSDSSITATSFFESSDASLKTLIADNYQAKGIDSVIAKLYIKNGKEELGYFAQDLQDVLPSAVSKGSDGLLNLSYREVHTAKIAYLEEEIRQLKKKYENN